MSVHEAHKALLAPLRAALRSCDGDLIRSTLFDVIADEADIRLGAPFGRLTGAGDLWNKVYAPLLQAMPDMDRNEFIVMAGPRWGGQEDSHWVGLGGNIVGTLGAVWLGIPAQHHPVFMRYHEYYRISGGKVVQMQGLWDIAQVMKQAGVWPAAPQLGVEWMCPGPADGRGVIDAAHDADKARASVQLVWDMLHDLKQGTADTPERGLGGFWHPNAVWYGPTGLGTARGHAAIANRIFRQFRQGLSRNTRHLEDGVFFGDHDLVAFTGWPSGTAMHTGDGFLGMAPTGRRITRCSLDFWRVENGLVRECWVMVDMIDLLRQMGVDVFARMAALAPARSAA